MKRAVLVLVILLAVAAVWWFVFLDGGGDADIQEPSPSDGGGLMSPIDFDTLQQDPTFQDAGPALETKGSEREDEPAQPSTPEPTAAPVPFVDCILVLVDARGNELAPPTGTLGMSWHIAFDDGATSRREHKELEVVEGRFRARLRRGYEVEPSRFTYGDRVAVPIDDDPKVPLEGPFELRMHEVRPTILHVVDAGTRAPIARASVTVPRDWSAGYLAYPGKHDGPTLRHDDASTPITLSTTLEGDLRHEHTVFVSAPGYAYKRIVLDTIVGGERTVELDAGGTLEVALAGRKAPRSASLRAWPADASNLRQQPVLDYELDRQEKVVLRHFPVGSWTLALQEGYYWRGGAILGRIHATVEAGGHTRVRLELEASADTVKPARLAGRLVVPTDYARAPTRIQFQYADKGASSVYRSVGTRGKYTLTRVEGKPGEWHFDAGTVRPGRWQAKVEPLGFRTTVVVPPEGVTDAVVQVSEPATIRARVVDLESGKTLEIASVDWHMALTPGISSWSSDQAVFDKASERFVIKVPAGTVHVEPDDEAWNGEEQVLELRAGETRDITLGVRATAIIDLDFMAGTARIPFDWEWDVKVEQIDGEGSGFMWGDREGFHRVWVDRPGRYRVSVGNVPGYKPLQPQEVIAEPGKPVRVTFELLRAK